MITDYLKNTKKENGRIDRVCILIDGGNFFHLALKNLKMTEGDFNFESFVLFLVGKRILCNMGKRYYVGTVREKEGDDRSKRAMSLQTRLFTKLKNSGWEIRTSKLKTRIEEVHVDSRILEYKELLQKGITKITIERLREKGIDVKIATDLIAGAVDDQYDTAVVISSDADLIPAIDWVRHRCNKKVEYVGFSFPNIEVPTKSIRPLISMISKTDIQRTLTEQDLLKFIIPKLPI